VKRPAAAGTINMSASAHTDQSHQRLAAIIESSEDGIVSKDLDGIVTTWNRGAERIFGYRADEVIGQSIVIIIPEDLQGEEPEILRRIRNGERIEHYETVRQRKDRSLVEISLTVSPVRNGAGRIVGVSKIARDISARRKAEQQAWELSERLHNLADQQRSRIADELLDSIGQHLAAIGLHAMNLGSCPGIQGDALKYLKLINCALAKAAEDLHGFTYRLRPPGFASGNLFESLRQYVEGFGRRTGLTATLNLRSSYSEPSISLQRATLRVVQEALTNVHRHASATSVHVDLAGEDSLLYVTVEDNGKGMAATGGDQDVFSLGIGIKWMMTRIRQLGGQVSIRSGPQGTSVRVVVPTVHSDCG